MLIHCVLNMKREKQAVLIKANIFLISEIKHLNSFKHVFPSL